jgi:hypothetical protein
MASTNERLKRAADSLRTTIDASRAAREARATKATIASCISTSTRSLTLTKIHHGFAFVFDDTGTVESGTYVEAENKFQALDKLRAIYADPAWRLRFDLS